MNKITISIFLILAIARYSAMSQVNSSAGQDSLKNKSNTETDYSENSFIDSRDNQVYSFIEIDGKKWMAENLNFKSPKSLIYDNNEKNADTYGRLYTWEEAKCSCPENWRLPTEDEWQQLEKTIGLDQMTIDSIGWRGTPYGNVLKSKNNKTWLNSIHDSPKTSGFDGIAGGLAYNNDYFANIGLGGYYWTSTNYYSSFAWSRYLNYNKGDIFRNISIITWYFSVRCIQD